MNASTRFSSIRVDDDFDYDVLDEYSDYYYSDLNADPDTNGYVIDPNNADLKQITLTISGSGTGTLSWAISPNINVWWKGPGNNGDWGLVHNGDSIGNVAANGQARTLVIQGVRPELGQIKATFSRNGQSASDYEGWGVFSPLRITGSNVQAQALVQLLESSTGYDFELTTNGYAWIVGGYATSSSTQSQLRFRQQYGTIWRSTKTTSVNAVFLVSGGEPFDNFALGNISTAQIQAVMNANQTVGSAILMHCFMEQYGKDVLSLGYPQAHSLALAAECSVMDAAFRESGSDGGTPASCFMTWTFISLAELELTFDYNVATGVITNVAIAYH